MRHYRQRGRVLASDESRKGPSRAGASRLDFSVGGLTWAPAPQVGLRCFFVLWRGAGLWDGQFQDLREAAQERRLGD